MHYFAHIIGLISILLGFFRTKLTIIFAGLSYLIVFNGFIVIANDTFLGKIAHIDTL